MRVNCDTSMYTSIMSAVATALDMHTQTNFGENGFSQYTWSNDLKEKVLQFSFLVFRQSMKKPGSVLGGSLESIVAS